MAKKGFLDGYKTYDTSNGYGNANKWRDAFKKRMTIDEANAILDQISESPQVILGVTINASFIEIKKAYRAKLHEWHPDKNQHRIEEANTMIDRIVAAYTRLKP
jgi:DnaJ-domain-containing protein 1